MSEPGRYTLLVVILEGISWFLIQLRQQEKSYQDDISFSEIFDHFYRQLVWKGQISIKLIKRKFTLKNRQIKIRHAYQEQS